MRKETNLIPDVRREHDHWWEQGACYRTFDVRFFGTKEQRKEVKEEFCNGCVVKGLCVESKEHYGVWGGTLGRGA